MIVLYSCNYTKLHELQQTKETTAKTPNYRNYTKTAATTPNYSNYTELQQPHKIKLHQLQQTQQVQQQH